MNNKPFKGKLPEDKEEILNILRTESVQDIAAMLCFIPEEDKWYLMRDTLLSIRTEMVGTWNENPKLRAIDYLYVLLRFIETSSRFPSREEQDELFQELKSISLRNKRKTVSMVTLIQEASESSRSRKAARQLKEIERSYRDEGQALPDAPKRYEGGADEEW